MLDLHDWSLVKLQDLHSTAYLERCRFASFARLEPGIVTRLAFNGLLGALYRDVQDLHDWSLVKFARLAFKGLLGASICKLCTFFSETCFQWIFAEVEVDEVLEKRLSHTSARAGSMRTRVELVLKNSALHVTTLHEPRTLPTPRASDQATPARPRSDATPLRRSAAPPRHARG